MATIDLLKQRRITDSTFNLYKKNLERLNDNKEVKNFTFLKNIEAIQQKLEKYSPNTRRSYIISIVSILKLDPKQEKLYKEYYGIMKKMNDDHKENPNKSDKQKDNWISQDDVKQIYNDLGEVVIPLFGKKKLTEQEYDAILNYMILSLYVLDKPRRNADYQKMVIVKKWNDGMDKAYNYLDLTNHKFIFCNFKTAKTYQNQEVPISDELFKVITQYLKIMKRYEKPDGPRYFLIKQDGSHLSNINDITKRLNKIFGKKIGASMLRNIFATSELKDLKDELKEAADSMGTSVDQLINTYIKDD